MKTKNLLLYLILIFSIVFVGAFTYVQRKYILPSDASSNIQVELIWSAYDTNHVALEYDVLGTIQTSDGSYNECPLGKSVVSNATGEDITGETYTSCRFVSEGKYSVTQFFYNDFSNKQPAQVNIQIGDLLFFSSKTNEEIYVPVLQNFVFALQQLDPSITAHPSELTVAHNGIDMAIQRVDLTPRTAKVEACLTLPDKRDWGVDAYMVMGDQTFPINYWEIPNYRENHPFANQHRCFRFLFTDISDFREFNPGSISFVTQKVYMHMPDCVNISGYNKIKDELEKYGISLEPDTAGGYCFSSQIVNLGDVDANAHLFTYIKDTLKEEVEGPLAITIK